MESVGLMDYKNDLINAFRGKTVLITGHTGFKGGWLALWLHSLGANVIGYGLDPSSSPSFFQKTRLSRKITDIRGDILDYKKILDVVTKSSPDFVFHLAAQPLVRASYKNPAYTFNVNFMGTVNVLEAIRVTAHPTICVCITSDKCYENMECDYPYRESDQMGGHDPYSASKGAAEIAIASYRKSFFNPSMSKSTSSLSSVRAGNIIGGGDWAEDRIVPDCIRSLVKSEPIKIRNPLAIRPWQWVLEPLLGYLLLALKMRENQKEYCGAWNFGPSTSNNVTVQTIAEKIICNWGSGSWESPVQNSDNLHEAKYLKLDITKSVSRLGWKPVYSIDDAILKTVEWYKTDYNQVEDMDKFSLCQIEAYLQDAKLKQ